ncbi:MAG: bifunctional diaminohydroxyphosphoribosylaminopyrimidine deaminase/5-amino-6-(5-phosphoribosylamino)uracil reductase RibD [Nitrospiraceae bacterium]|nr:bifunctional diaminohydroxyphosphoribosylaminopyrimidine deaminase/5-amino-6-(5-phosphoribosylamino)uracil reductase RibD [Nitrospiraceae bacterium]
MNNRSRDEHYMSLALRLAGKAKGRTSPNPMVGAVVVKNGKVIAKGYHQKAGGPHAEAIALRKAGTAARGATLYVTLEPCSHTNKRTPPCSPLVISSGVKRVVIAMIDPNPQVSGRGVKALRKAGIAVFTGVLEAEARKLNEAFIKYMSTGMPFVTLKIAQTLDGRIATSRGESKWITGEEARREGHRLRDANDAILVGVNTVLNDDPSLTTRIPGGRDPLRVVVDSTLRIPIKAKVLAQRSAATTMIATLMTAKADRFHRLLERGAEILITRSARKRVDLADLMRMLTTFGITSVLIEGGAEVNASALGAGIVDKVVLFVAPTLMTGKDSLCSVGGTSPVKLAHAVQLRDIAVRRVGMDLMVEGYVQKKDVTATRRRQRT